MWKGCTLIVKKDFERKLAAETKANNKGFWNYVNSRRKTRTKIADLRTNSGAFTSDDLDKADIQRYIQRFMMHITHARQVCKEILTGYRTGQ